jgi:EAL domain-containing protein (putative c-di-GMP-specific phosphodiesterase class I)
MAHSLKMSVVAEGVEHQNQFDLLRAEGCDEYQGYLCRPALEESELLKFLAEERANRAPAPIRQTIA